MIASKCNFSLFLLMTTMTAKKDFFHRQELARLYAEDALDTSLGMSGGLFLAAPRRTGKSTFVRQDLVPALEAQGARVIYIDLWADKTKDPALLMGDAIRYELHQEAGLIGKMAQKTGLAKFSVGAFGNGLNFDLSLLGLSANATLSDALKALSMVHKATIVLVIDEVQHALTTQDGMNALFALKAARDSLNLSAHGLQVIATGSNRDKLALLVNGRDQPFFGATMVDFPTLGIDYIEWICDKAKLRLNKDEAFSVFQKAGSRPEMILPVLRQLRLEQTAPELLDQLFAKKVELAMTNAKLEFMQTVAGLPPLQVALLEELAKITQQNTLNPNVNPHQGLFSQQMLEKIKANLMNKGLKDNSTNIETSAIQNGLDNLREKNFLWRSQRGAYWLEDEQLLLWLTQPNSSH